MRPSSIASTGSHTGGETFPIVAGPSVANAGATVAGRRARPIEDPDVPALRAVPCDRLRGHADLHGGSVVPPDDDGAHLGVLVPGFVPR